MAGLLRVPSCTFVSLVVGKKASTTKATQYHEGNSYCSGVALPSQVVSEAVPARITPSANVQK